MKEVCKDIGLVVLQKMRSYYSTTKKECREVSLHTFGREVGFGLCLVGPVYCQAAELDECISDLI